MAVRGSIVANGRLFTVADNAFREVSAAGVVTLRGTLSTTTGRVGMEWGRDQIIITDGPNGYTLTLSSNSFNAISDADFPGGVMVSELDGFFITAPADSDQFNLSGLDDGSTWDALDFATAESRPDKAIAHASLNREFVICGEITTEWWFPTGGASFQFERRAVTAVGCLAPWSLKRVDNALMMIGRDEGGAGMVYMLSGYAARRVSNPALEDYLATSSDLAGSVAMTWQRNGETFYALQVPGLATTPVYQASVGEWVDLADVDESGDFVPWRFTDHAYCFGKNLVIAGDGTVHALDNAHHTYGATARKCSRTSRHMVGQLRERGRISEFVADVSTGQASDAADPQSVSLSWSNDGGRTFSTPVARAIGVKDDFTSPPRWRRLGMARDRVWRLEYSGKGQFTIIDVGIR